MTTGILLIHGFTGSPGDFGDLPAALARYGTIRSLRLPGHGGGAPPRFDADALPGAVEAAAREMVSLGLDLIVIGHSTGGSLALAALQESAIPVRLAVLASSPPRIDGSYLYRWQGHSPAGDALSFTSLAGLIALVNRTGSRGLRGDFPVLVIQGEEDELVPAAAAGVWEAMGAGDVRSVLVPGGGHHLFHGEAGRFAVDVVRRAVADASHRPDREEEATLALLNAVEPEAGAFLARAGGAARHIPLSPAGALLAEGTPELSPRAAGEPLFLNIEVTTRCNLRCAFCARTGHAPLERDMPLETFRRILDLVPSGYRVTLVGLGEPLLHPGIAALVAAAASKGRRVALVTNAMGLTPDKGKELVEAGLGAITFSLDAAHPGPAEAVRSGSRLDLILDQIRHFCATDAGRGIPRAIFTAVSAQTLPHLEELVRTAAGLGVDALMLSDLNFAGNAPHTLWQNASDEGVRALRGAVSLAFTLGLPVLSVRALEELGLPRRYREHLLVRPATLFERSSTRSHCFTPWQTLSVNVDGSVNACDCQPGTPAGNLLHTPLSELWQGEALSGQRRGMLGDAPPQSCRVCPRF